MEWSDVRGGTRQNRTWRGVAWQEGLSHPHGGSTLAGSVLDRFRAAGNPRGCGVKGEGALTLLAGLQPAQHCP